MQTRLARRSVLPLLLLSLLLVSCASGPPRAGYGGKGAPLLQEPVSGKESVLYVVPKSPDIISGDTTPPSWRRTEFHSALKGVGFPVFDNTDTKRTKITRCPEYDAAANTLVCEKVRMVSPGLTEEFSIVRYKVDVATVEKPDKYEFTLTPKIREIRNYRDLMLSVEAPPFPESELLDYLSAGRIRFKMQVDSQYDKGAVSANFTRLLGKGSRPLSPADAAKDRLIYRVKHEGWRAELAVEIWPYRGGSKVALTAVVDAQIAPAAAGTSRTVDIGKIIDEVRAEVEKVVKS